MPEFFCMGSRPVETGKKRTRKMLSEQIIQAVLCFALIEDVGLEENPQEATKQSFLVRNVQGSGGNLMVSGVFFRSGSVIH